MLETKKTADGGEFITRLPGRLVIKHRSGEIEFRLGARGSRGAITVLRIVNAGAIPHFREGDKLINIDCGGTVDIDSI